jgi:hypothetical protein
VKAVAAAAGQHNTLGTGYGQEKQELQEALKTDLEMGKGAHHAQQDVKYSKHWTDQG